MDRKYVKQNKFICFFSLFLELFIGCCWSLGCQQVPRVKRAFVRAALVVSTLCLVGHSSRFSLSCKVNGKYANSLQSVSAVVVRE